ncbi:hypothetical protein BV25DRAFT_1991500 [Artomyces pyxidatus]|uniref:Uncharacterized protein n=1 Tax=Artomyces pyxidatus TaxID=48021 RepID=A0ACB8T399_9AGAM|nr:hypothetical protein BV25DRAFT_1991500 [Artomyces pyxidatus]
MNKLPLWLESTSKRFVDLVREPCTLMTLKASEGFPPMHVRITHSFGAFGTTPAVLDLISALNSPDRATEEHIELATLADSTVRNTDEDVVAAEFVFPAFIQTYRERVRRSLMNKLPLWLESTSKRFVDLVREPCTLMTLKASEGFPPMHVRITHSFGAFGTTPAVLDLISALNSPDRATEEHIELATLAESTVRNTDEDVVAAEFVRGPVAALATLDGDDRTELFEHTAVQRCLQFLLTVLYKVIQL